MFGLGGGELGIVLLVVLLLFGPSQLPKMARAVGEAGGRLSSLGRVSSMAMSLTERYPRRPVGMPRPLTRLPGAAPLSCSNRALTSPADKARP